MFSIPVAARLSRALSRLIYETSSRVSNGATKVLRKSIPVLELRQNFKGFVIPTARQQLSREKKGDRHA
jgi:hypothetical protein